MEKINKSFLGAYRKGRKAWDEHGFGALCPYPDRRAGRHNHIVTFSRAFQRLWWEGWEDSRSGRPEQYSAK
jgi:hypothetical protein